MDRSAFLSAGEAARRLGVTARTLKRWEQEGHIDPAKRDYRKWRIYTEEDVDVIHNKRGLDRIITPNQPDTSM